MTDDGPNPVVQQRLHSYLDAIDVGRDPDVEQLCRGLSDEDRRLLLALIEQLGALHEDLDESVQAGRVVADRYRLAGQIGAGGFGSVWRAHDRHLRRKVAIKFIRLADPERDLERFQTEVNALIRTHCSGIAQVFDIGVCGDDAYIVLELVDGQPLSRVFEHVRERGMQQALTGDDLRTAIRYPPAPGQVDLCAEERARGAQCCWYRASARICATLLRTLETIHMTGIRHRDIKPSNVLLRGCGRPVLVDFGLAVECDVRAERGGPHDTLSGSLPYLPPECLKNRRTGTDGRSDVYQVGLLLYEFLALQPAHAASSEPDDDELQPQSAPAPPSAIRPDVPRDLERICLCALADEPEDRYQTATAFRRDLERWLAGDEAPIALQGSDTRSLWLRMPYFLRRHRAGALVLAGLVLGGVAAVSTIAALG